jgi:hypothetical protein
MSEDSFAYTVELTRGGDTNNRDKQRVKVTADTIEELHEKVEAVRNEMRDWAAEFRDIQPDRGRRLPDDQSELGEVEA